MSKYTRLISGQRLKMLKSRLEAWVMEEETNAYNLAHLAPRFIKLLTQEIQRVTQEPGSQGHDR